MNTRILHRCRVSLHSLLMGGALLGVGASTSASEVSVARYATLRPVATIAQRDPLAALVSPMFPSSITRVGEAIDTLLTPSGYRLDRAQPVAFGLAALLALPLPEVHRKFGPVPLRVALQTLAGPAFIVVEDPRHRLVSFERCDLTMDIQDP
jgi:conjugative transfer region protein (TIGR03748 family)